MSNSDNILDSQEILGRLARKADEQTQQIPVIASPGARAAAWPVTVKSNSSYNVYNVRAVELGYPGSVPVEIGAQMQAINLAESFLVTGSLPTDTYVVMLKLGEKNIFYSPI